MFSFAFLLFALLLSGAAALYIHRIPSEAILLRGQRVIRRGSLVLVILVFMGYKLPVSTPIPEVPTESDSSMDGQRDAMLLPLPAPNKIVTATLEQKPQTSLRPLRNLPAATGHPLESRGYAMTMNN